MLIKYYFYLIFILNNIFGFMTFLPNIKLLFYFINSFGIFFISVSKKVVPFFIVLFFYYFVVFFINNSKFIDLIISFRTLFIPLIFVYIYKKINIYDFILRYKKYIFFLGVVQLPIMYLQKNLLFDLYLHHRTNIDDVMSGTFFFQSDFSLSFYSFLLIYILIETNIFKLSIQKKIFFIFYFLFIIFYSNSSVFYLISFVYFCTKLRFKNFILFLGFIPLFVYFFSKFDYLFNLIPFLSSYSYTSTFLIEEGVRSKLLSLYFVIQNIEIYLFGNGPGHDYDYLSQTYKNEIFFDGFILRQISEYGFLGLLLYFSYIRKLFISSFPKISFFIFLLILLLSSAQYLFIDPSLLISLIMILAINNKDYLKHESTSN